MAVAYDASSNATAGQGNLSWTHTPVGTPRGVIVLLVGDEGVDDVTSVTYGGVSMSEVALSPVVKGTGEPGAAHCFFLGSGVPTGAKTVSVTATGTSTHMASAFTLTASADTAIEDTSSISQDTGSNPSVTLTIANDSWCAIGFMSGQVAISGITPLTGWTGTQEFDFGGVVGGIYRKNANSSTDVAAGYTASTDDCCLIAVAVKESNILTANKSDTITTSESRAIDIPVATSKSDTITISESISVSIPVPPLSANVSDTITLSESLSIIVFPPDLGVVVMPGVQQVANLVVS